MVKEIITIKTLRGNRRIGVKSSVDLERFFGEGFLSREYLLNNIDALPDGDYPISLFKEDPYAVLAIPVNDRAAHLNSNSMTYIGK